MHRPVPMGWPDLTAVSCYTRACICVSQTRLRPPQGPVHVTKVATPEIEAQNLMPSLPGRWSRDCQASRGFAERRKTILLPMRQNTPGTKKRGSCAYGPGAEDGRPSFKLQALANA
uniref:Uncharacterized protein n=1 Tax=Mycena chlorophos TaxID=658473 RepID=A0ABQ0M3T0_MYCCL|nr:predicted protein [Mycena chlorophos]